ncbi:MAG: hypothetical protein KKB37_11450 [Alphaproteobacteria bacterium]|nr:hypothetical protein [Alphaproteobacteria bacterium]
MSRIEKIVARASQALFSKPLVTNVYRSVIAEAIVADALGDWEWCSADYASCDFTHRDGRRLEVKQSAYRQTWTTDRLSRPSWDVAARTGYWEDGVVWVDEPGRNADIYVLCLHVVKDESADHRDPAQWSFFVIATDRLPDIKRLSLARAHSITEPVLYDQLASQVDSVAPPFART